MIMAIRLQGGEIKLLNPESLFASLPSHLGISNGEACTITIGYRDETASGATAHVPETKQDVTSFSFFLGDLIECRITLTLLFKGHSI